MFVLLADENFDNDMLRGLERRGVVVDIRRVQDVGLYHGKDPVILEWAAVQNAILVTHDRKTMSKFAFARVAAGQAMPGVWIIDDSLSVRDAVDQLELLVSCSDPAEWSGRVLFIPLR
jgi:predicted nuclease of predicted toxin-antitoxin system